MDIPGERFAGVSVALTSRRRSSGGSVSEPAEAELVDPRLQRAARQPRLGRQLGVVVTAGGDVIGRVRGEDRGQVLDLAATRAELGLAAAVGADAALLAVVVGGEEVADRAEARGLDVDRLRRRPGHRLDV